MAACIVLHCPIFLCRYQYSTRYILGQRNNFITVLHDEGNVMQIFFSWFSLPLRVQYSSYYRTEGAAWLSG
jgi:hypothetical protein